MPAPFEVAALQGAIDIIHAVQVRLAVKGMRRFGIGAYIAIAEYEVGEQVRKMQRKERSRLARLLRDRVRKQRKRGR